jgi:signal transduction histidine kinase
MLPRTNQFFMSVPASKRWPIALFGVLAAYVAVTALYLHQVSGPPEVQPPKNLFLVGFADISQFILILAPGLVAIRKTFRSHARARAFWALMAAGFVTWAFAQAGWVYLEVFRRQSIPDPFWADVVLFFHFVPFTAALIVRPHVPGELRKIMLSAIDWSMVLLWWLYLYVFLVFPAQFIRLDAVAYDKSYNALYLAENLVWLGLLAYFFITMRGEWRVTFGSLLGAGTLYIASSQIINLAIARGSYYSGSFYDVPLVVAVMWFLWSVVVAPEEASASDANPYTDTPDEHAWVPRIALLALLSIPILAVGMELSTPSHGPIFRFRLIVTMIAIVMIGAMVFFKQYLLDRERVRLLAESRRAYVDLQRIQAQLVQSEKLASIGQLVSGAAHEINNPLTAILGYSELMESDPSANETIRAHATKIKIQALRTRNLVGNLLKFARQSKPERKLVQLNSVAENALQLRGMDQFGKPVRFMRELQPDLPWTWGDAAQLTDVCLQLLGNAADAISNQGGIIILRTYAANDFVNLEVVDNGTGISEPNRVFDPFYTTKGPGKGSGLGLSVCYGIIADHKGEITAENMPGGGARFLIRLPMAQSSAANQSGNAASSQQS